MVEIQKQPYDDIINYRWIHWQMSLGMQYLWSLMLMMMRLLRHGVTAEFIVWLDGRSVRDIAPNVLRLVSTRRHNSVQSRSR
jgi:hypothetical protein